MSHVERYLGSGLRRVPGWLHPFSARYIAELGMFQKAAGLFGPCAEIGVHHGRLFILLHLGGSGRDVAIDVFRNQHLNADRSGRGDRERFIENVRRWGGDVDRIRIIEKSSLDVSPGEITQDSGPISLFSVDGGHTAECALNDLMLAEACLAPAGVVILDDFYNEAWPEVCVGATQYFLRAGGLRPFAITPNKLYLCWPEYNAFYRQGLRQRFPRRNHDKDATVFGAPVCVMGVVRYGTLGTAKNRIADSAFGPVLKQWLRRTRVEA